MTGKPLTGRMVACATSEICLMVTAGPDALDAHAARTRKTRAGPRSRPFHWVIRLELQLHVETNFARILIGVRLAIAPIGNEAEGHLAVELALPVDVAAEERRGLHRVVGRTGLGAEARLRRGRSARRHRRRAVAASGEVADDDAGGAGDWIVVRRLLRIEQVRDQRADLHVEAVHHPDAMGKAEIGLRDVRRAPEV